MSAVPVNIADLFDKSLFDAMVDAKYIRVQTHPTLPLFIANYSERAQYDRMWNAATLQCRGLIYTADGTVVARPFPKFFNYGDDENTGPLDLTAPVTVTDKMDGSLGILYPSGDGWAVATRGSFTSDQARHATAVLHERYAGYEPPAGMTVLVEIVYPDNRIVVDYGKTDDLVFLTALDIVTGAEDRNHWALWRGPVAERFPHATLADALAADPRPNAEGFVVTYNDGKRVKLKQADYVALHRIITGLNARIVWEQLGAGVSLRELCEPLPDEFHDWVWSVARELTDKAGAIIAAATADYNMIPGGLERKDFARAAQGSKLRPYMFLLYDGQTERARQLAWREIRPSGDWTLVNHSEVVA